MPSFALHRFMTADEITPFVVKRGKKRYTLRYVDTDRKGAEKIAGLGRIKYGYGAIVAKVTVLDPTHQRSLGQKTAWGVFIRKGGRP